jgi:hypothetical protein
VLAVAGEDLVTLGGVHVPGIDTGKPQL